MKCHGTIRELKTQNDNLHAEIARLHEEIQLLELQIKKMRVRDLQEFLSTFTARDKSVTKQGNAISDAVIFVEINGYLEEIRKMEVYENNQTIFGAVKNPPFS